MAVDLVVSLRIRDDRLSVGALDVVAAETEELNADIGVPCS